MKNHENNTLKSHNNKKKYLEINLIKQVKNIVSEKYKTLKEIKI